MRRWGLWAALVSGLFVTPLAAEVLELPFEDLALVQDALTGEDLISIRLTPEAAGLFADFTAERIGRQVHLSANGVLLISPVVRTGIAGGVLEVHPGTYEAAGHTSAEIIARLEAGRVITVSD